MYLCIYRMYQRGPISWNLHEFFCKVEHFDYSAFIIAIIGWNVHHRWKDIFTGNFLFQLTNKSLS